MKSIHYPLSKFYPFCTFSFVEGVPILHLRTEKPTEPFYEIPADAFELRVTYPESAARIEKLEAMTFSRGIYELRGRLPMKTGLAAWLPDQSSPSAAIPSAPECRCVSILFGHDNDCDYANRRKEC